jgi:hypothetical protein
MVFICIVPASSHTGSKFEDKKMADDRPLNHSSEN